jgi:hypothetical protein
VSFLLCLSGEKMSLGLWRLPTGARKDFFSITRTRTKKIHLILSSLCANNTENKNDNERQPQSESAEVFSTSSVLSLCPSFLLLSLRETERERERDGFGER